MRTLIDPDAPSADYTGLLGFQDTVDLDLDLEPGIMTFAFGKRAYYLYWKTADGRVTWGANLPSKQYLSTTDARAIPAADWLAKLRETYAGDIPGGQLADGSTEETLQITGAIHIMPPVPHWYRDRMVLVGDAVHAPSNSTGQGASLAIESAIQLARCLRDLPDPASAFATYEHLRRDRVEKITRRGARTNSAKTPGPVARRIMQTVHAPVLQGHGLREDDRAGAAVHDRLARTRHRRTRRPDQVTRTAGHPHGLDIHPSCSQMHLALCTEGSSFKHRHGSGRPSRIRQTGDLEAVRTQRLCGQIAMRAGLLPDLRAARSKERQMLGLKARTVCAL